MADPPPDPHEAARLMGWIILLALFGASLGALRLLGAADGFLKGCAAALLIGASGYALQGRPGLSGSLAQGSEGRDIFPLTDARHAFFGALTPAESWLRMSEALARDGRSEDSIGILENAVRRYPRDPQLWIGLGNALVDHARSLTPPAELAFARAAELAPGHPAAPFFYGLALARSGDREGAVALWSQILAKAPPKASWRPLVEQGVAALGRPPPQPATGS